MGSSGNAGHDMSTGAGPGGVGGTISFMHTVTAHVQVHLLVSACCKACSACLYHSVWQLQCRSAEAVYKASGVGSDACRRVHKILYTVCIPMDECLEHIASALQPFAMAAATVTAMVIDTSEFGRISLASHATSKLMNAGTNDMGSSAAKGGSGGKSGGGLMSKIKEKITHK